MNKIGWTDCTWNPVTGCTPISVGCTRCWASRMSKRLAGRYGYPPAPHNFDVTLHPDRLEEPLHWKKPRRIFVCSMGDLFHEDVPDEFICKVFSQMAMASSCNGHIFQVLTKRAERMYHFMKAVEADIEEQKKPIYNADGTTTHRVVWAFPFRYIRLGVSVSNQAMVDEYIPWLLKTPAAVRFVSAEPLLGAINFLQFPTWYQWGCSGRDGRGIHHHDNHCQIPYNQIIVGAETGSGARPMSSSATTPA